MSAISEPRPVTKRSGRPKRSQRDDITVKVDRNVITRAKFVADTRKITLAEYLTEVLRPHVEKDFAWALKHGEAAGNKG